MVILLTKALCLSRKHICQQFQDRWSSIKTLYFVLAFSQRQRDEQFIHEYYSEDVCVCCEGKSAFVHEKTLQDFKPTNADFQLRSGSS